MEEQELTNAINEIHRKHLNAIHELFKAKNADYGNSFFKMNKTSDLYPMFFDIRRKYIRLEAMVNNQRLGKPIQVGSETLQDTLKDLANYAIMISTLMDLEEQHGLKKEGLVVKETFFSKLEEALGPEINNIPKYSELKEQMLGKVKKDGDDEPDCPTNNRMCEV